MLRSIVVVAAALGGALFACNAYNPDLDSVPFLCDPSDRECPDGYEAVDVGAPNFCECREDGNGGPTADAANGCARDAAFEPNETTAMATSTPIGQGSTTFVAAGSVCTGTDIDFYKLSAETGTTVRVSLTFAPAVGALALKITDASGVMLAEGTMQGAALVATHAVTVSSTYYAEVLSASGTNDYDLTIALQ